MRNYACKLTAVPDKPQFLASPCLWVTACLLQQVMNITVFHEFQAQ